MAAPARLQRTRIIDAIGQPLAVHIGHRAFSALRKHTLICLSVHMQREHAGAQHYRGDIDRRFAINARPISTAFPLQQLDLPYFPIHLDLDRHARRPSRRAAFFHPLASGWASLELERLPLAPPPFAGRMPSKSAAAMRAAAFESSLASTCEPLSTSSRSR